MLSARDYEDEEQERRFSDRNTLKERDAEFACAQGEVIGGSVESVLSLAAESGVWTLTLSLLSL